MRKLISPIAICVLIIISLCIVVYIQNSQIEKMKLSLESLKSELKSNESNQNLENSSVLESLAKGMDLSFTDLYDYLECPIYQGDDVNQLKEVVDEVIRIDLLGNSKILKIDDKSRMDDGRFRFSLLCYQPLNSEMLEMLKTEHVFSGVIKAYYVLIDFSAVPLKIELLKP